MSFLEYLRTHHPCRRGAYYVLAECGGDPLRFWRQCPRPEWLCWVLDAAFCQHGSTPHEHVRCTLPYNVREDDPFTLPMWWRHVAGPMARLDVAASLKDWLRTDDELQLTTWADPLTMQAWTEAIGPISQKWGPWWDGFVASGFSDAYPRPDLAGLPVQAKARKPATPRRSRPKRKAVAE